MSNLFIDVCKNRHLFKYDINSVLFILTKYKNIEQTIMDKQIEGHRPSPKTSIDAKPKLTARTMKGALKDVPKPKIVRCLGIPCKRTKLVKIKYIMSHFNYFS